MTVEGPPVAVVVPSLEGPVEALLQSIERQTLRPREVEVVRGVRPSGRARNVGAARTTAPILVFVDDDAVLGGDDTLASLAVPLLADRTVGATGASRLLPPEASRFQRMVARQVPRIEHAVVPEPVETNPPMKGHGYVDISTTCCAMRRTVFEEVGGFDEGMVRGVDTELWGRLHRLGYRLVLVPRTWVYHPAPRTLGSLLRKHFMYGVGFAQEVRRRHDKGGWRFLRTPAHAVAYLAVRTVLLVPHAVIPYTHAVPSWRPGFKPLRAVASYAAAVGYVYGWYRHRDRMSVPDGEPVP